MEAADRQQKAVISMLPVTTVTTTVKTTTTRVQHTHFPSLEFPPFHPETAATHPPSLSLSEPLFHGTSAADRFPFATVPLPAVFQHFQFDLNNVPLQLQHQSVRFVNDCRFSH
jgi:hypothetical protein